MLILRRSVGEGITITIPPSTDPQQINIKVVDVRGERARLGFDAPSEIFIHRDEIHERILQAQEQS